MRFLFLFLLSFFSLSIFAQDCVKQVNVPATYEEEELVITMPPVKVLVKPAVLDTITQKVCVRDAAMEESIVCDEDGSFRKCTKEIPALYQEIQYFVEIMPAQYIEYGGVVKKLKKQKLVKNGYIKTYSVPCD